MRIRLFWRVMPFYICIGLLFAVPVLQRHALALQAARQARVAETHLAAASRQHQPPLISGNPVRIVIGSLGIDLGIVPGSYVSDQAGWTVSGSQANYATNSALLNNQTNKTLIYGHANNRVFTPTVGLKPGDTAYVFADNGRVFEYMFTGSTVVKPTDVAVLDSLRGKPGLVLMSCDGSWYQNRRLMYFDLVRAS